MSETEGQDGARAKEIKLEDLGLSEGELTLFAKGARFLFGPRTDETQPAAEDEAVVTIRIPVNLRGVTDQQEEIKAQANSVREALQSIETRYAGFADRIVAPNGEVRRFVAIYLNDESIQFLEGLDTPVNEGDVITILPALSGG